MYLNPCKQRYLQSSLKVFRPRNENLNILERIYFYIASNDKYKKLENLLVLGRRTGLIMRTWVFKTDTSRISIQARYLNSQDLSRYQLGKSNLDFKYKVLIIRRVVMNPVQINFLFNHPRRFNTRIISK